MRAGILEHFHAITDQTRWIVREVANEIDNKVVSRARLSYARYPN